MDANTIDTILQETAYTRTGGSPEELRCALYLQAQCKNLGFEATLEPFTVAMATMKTAKLIVDGREIPCKGYLCAGSGTVEAPIYYLRDSSSYSLSQCKGNIVLVDGYMGYWKYQDILENGAVGFITYDGDANYADRDIDQRELREFVHRGTKILGVNINAKDAIALVKQPLPSSHWSRRNTPPIPITWFWISPAGMASISYSPPITTPLPCPRVLTITCPVPSACWVFWKRWGNRRTITVCGSSGAAVRNGDCLVPRPMWLPMRKN